MSPTANGHAASFPPAPTSAIDWTQDVGFRIREVNGHIECHYSVKTGQWSEPSFVRDPHLTLHGLSPALNYGMQCYEGMKAFRRPDGRITIFRPAMNAERMQTSGAFVSIPPVPSSLFLHCVNLAVALNADFVGPHESSASLYIRPLLLGSSPQIALVAPEEFLFCVYVNPVSTYAGVNPVDGAILEEYDRAAPVGAGGAKVGGNYAPVMRWSQKYKKDGYSITLHLDSKTRTVIDEWSTSGFIGLRKAEGGKYTVVVPDSKQAIVSVTSESCCAIAEMLGWTVEKRPVKYEELASFDEVLAAGTAAALLPIRSITSKSDGQKFTYLYGDKPGPACVELLENYKGIQRGLLPDKLGWNEEVLPPKDFINLAKSVSGANGEVASGQLP